MKISIGADERKPVVDDVIEYLKKKGHILRWYGPSGLENTPWPEVAVSVARDVAGGQAEEGILFCWTGTGVCMAANKIKGVRAALCADAETARGARLWNDANVLCMSLRKTSSAVAVEILDAWFATAYQPNPDDDACLEKIKQLDTDRTSP